MVNIKIADCTFGLETHHTLMERICADYLCPEPPQVVLHASEEDMEAMREQMPGIPEADCESCVLHRQVCDHLLRHQVLGFHSAAFAFDGRAVLVTAPSGTGKFTHSRLWRERWGERVRVINDDKPFLRFADEVYALGSPWCGKEWLQNNIEAPLSAIIALHRAPTNSIRRVADTGEAFSLLMPACYRPASADGVLQVATLAARLCSYPVFALGCTPTQEAVTVVYDALTSLQP